LGHDKLRVVTVVKYDIGLAKYTAARKEKFDAKPIWKRKAMPLTLDQAYTVARTALEEGKARGFAPLCAVVLDAGAHTLCLMRDEHASISRPEIATGKAAGCLGMGFGGRELAKRVAAMPHFFSALSGVFPKGIIPVPGGVLIRDSAGALVGAVGVSGDTSDNDEVCAIAGVLAAGLVADTGA
jgi:uncharacterized protein GlcG (DUF336 family)